MSGVKELRSRREELAEQVAASRSSSRNKELTTKCLSGATFRQLAYEYSIAPETARYIVVKTCRKAEEQHARRLLEAEWAKPKPKRVTKLDAMMAKHGWPVRPKVTWIRD